MKRFLLLITFLFSAIFILSAETIFMKAGSKTFELEVKKTVCGKDFLRFIKDKTLKMQKYGGFEFYVYENHSLGSNEAVLIGTFKDKSVSDFLKNADKNISFSFYSK